MARKKKVLDQGGTNTQAYTRAPNGHFAEGNRGGPGEPTIYNRLIANTILERLVKGESILEIVRDADMPGERTIFRWLATKPEFQQDYAKVTEIRAHLYAERQLLCALEAVDVDSAAAARVKADAYRWMAARMLPKVWGDKLLHTGADGEGPVAVKLSLDYTLLDPHEMLEFRRMLAKMERKGDTHLIEGAAEEDD